MMNSTRRGFLGLIGGGAVSGPGVLKQAVAKASTLDSVGAAANVMSQQVGPSSYNHWIAPEIMRMIETRNQPARSDPHEHWLADIQALKSVSMVSKCRMQRERNMDLQAAHLLRDFIKEHKLNWVGLTEDKILSLVKKAAGE